MQQVDILLATYKPNSVYFRKLLGSLNDQTYSSLKLIVRDDSGDEESFLKVKYDVEQYITAFDFEIYKNEENIGSNKTFEQLTIDADGQYLAYCDQDDIWEKEKISSLVDVIERENGVLCYSDLSIIDKDDNKVANSFKDIHKRLQHVAGNNLFKYFLRRNSVTGCAMLIKSKVAKDALPFFTGYYVHDHWLALFASSVGRISYVPEPLIRYRIHGENQIGASMLNGIESRDDYYRKKLLKERDKFKYLLTNYNFNDDCEEAIKSIFHWTEERISFFERKNVVNTISMIKKIKDDYQLILLEMAINYLPSMVGKKIISKVKK
jgi:glycosyltransferase involved in cell wall biosynthesis